MKIFVKLGWDVIYIMTFLLVSKNLKCFSRKLWKVFMADD